MLQALAPPVRPGSPRYTQLMQQHDAWVAQYGVSLVLTEDLQTRAQLYAEQVWRAPCRSTISATQTEYGRSFVESNRLGQIGAALVASYFEMPCNWRVYDQRDPGWDVTVWCVGGGSVRIDVKTRRGLLVIPDRFETQPTADALALVTYDVARFMLCGVISISDYRAHKIKFALGHEPSWAVPTQLLEPPSHCRARLLGH